MMQGYLSTVRHSRSRKLCLKKEFLWKDVNWKRLVCVVMICSCERFFLLVLYYLYHTSVVDLHVRRMHCLGRAAK